MSCSFLQRLTSPVLSLTSYKGRSCYILDLDRSVMIHLSWTTDEGWNGDFFFTTTKWNNTIITEDEASNLRSIPHFVLPSQTPRSLELLHLRSLRIATLMWWRVCAMLSEAATPPPAMRTIRVRCDAYFCCINLRDTKSPYSYSYG